MAFPCFPSRSHQGYWDEFSLKGLEVKVKSPKKVAVKAPPSPPPSTTTTTTATKGRGALEGVSEKDDGRRRRSNDKIKHDAGGGGSSKPAKIPPYFWGEGFRGRFRRFLSRHASRAPRRSPFPTYAGYAEARSLIGQGAVADLEFLCRQASNFVTQVFEDADESSWSHSVDGRRATLTTTATATTATTASVQLRLSPELEQWKENQRQAGKVLPPKGAGLSQASDETVEILGVRDWPEALKTNNALFGCGIASLLMGAADAPTMFSNYVTDMAFYYEHGYNYVFPALEPLLQKAIEDPFARRTFQGRERRDAVRVGKEYIQGKIALERQHKAGLTNLSARMDRRTAQVLSLSESSLLGMAAEAAARGFDPASVMADLVFSSPGTDVVDVGCDLINSEVMNSFLNTADVTDAGVVSEEVLRRVYDAHAAHGARMLTRRWHEPVARMCAALYTWHIHNDRHLFFRRAVLGWPKARKAPVVPQREADFDEVFDARYRTTGFSRPLDPAYSCNGEDTCNHVLDHLRRHAGGGSDRKGGEPLLSELWEWLVTLPLAYVRAGEVDDEREKELVEGSRVRMAKLFARGKVVEMVWLVAHASHHAWQVNFLFEAAMFGSILDSGKLAGKLDRAEE
ncbi:hypothetical protein N3K66_006236 [Trichothecium roseum]|uniref:Uncharacterized protein n=1 Tax=Trichothecium roseum TaxID=47278 RepID=A0ACC0V1X7_9HYPO|nr:hypothetical protein N3K66_006236 [Trichothecium roseum]